MATSQPLPTCGPPKSLKHSILPGTEENSLPSLLPCFEKLINTPAGVRFIYDCAAGSWGTGSFKNFSHTYTHTQNATGSWYALETLSDHATTVKKKKGNKTKAKAPETGMIVVCAGRDFETLDVAPILTE